MAFFPLQQKLFAELHAFSTCRCNASEEATWAAPEDGDEKIVLVCGKTGVGKSSLINALTGTTSAEIGALEVGTRAIASHPAPEREIELVDTPGFYDVEGRTPEGVLKEMAGVLEEYHSVVYCQPASDRRMRLEDQQSIEVLVTALGAAATTRIIIALTFGNEARCIAEGLWDERVEGEEEPVPYTETPPVLEAVVCGIAGDGAGWEDELCSTLRHVSTGRAPVPLAIKWASLRKMGMMDVEPRAPPPPMELVNEFIEAMTGTFSQAGADGVSRRCRVASPVAIDGMPSGFGSSFCCITEFEGAADSIEEGCTAALLRGSAVSKVVMVMPAGEASVMRVDNGSVPRRRQAKSYQELVSGKWKVKLGDLKSGLGGGDQADTFVLTGSGFQSSSEMIRDRSVILFSNDVEVPTVLKRET
eukprot:gene3474-4364_t